MAKLTKSGIETKSAATTTMWDHCATVDNGKSFEKTYIYTRSKRIYFFLRYCCCLQANVTRPQWRRSTPILLPKIGDCFALRSRRSVFLANSDSFGYEVVLWWCYLGLAICLVERIWESLKNIGWCLKIFKNFIFIKSLLKCMLIMVC